MKVFQIEELEERAEKCIPMLRGDLLKLAAAKLSLAAYKHGWDRGWTKATENEEQEESGVRRTSEVEKESIIHEYDALVNRYNSLVDRYNSLARADDALIEAQRTYISMQSQIDEILASSPTRSSFPSLIPPPPPRPREFYLNCTATALPGNMAAVNCW